MPNQAHLGDAELAIVGSTGYAGQVLHALAMQHPCVAPWVVSAREPASVSPEERAHLCASDVVALALPGQPARTWTRALLDWGVRRVLDLSDAHRRESHAHYGIPELEGAAPESARVLANPGCYPTATLLALKPLIRAGVIDKGPIAIVGLSGASGAGKSLAERLHFCNLEGNAFPYKVGNHRHVPEIEHHLGAQVCFVTELLPISRGMLVTAFVQPKVEPAGLVETLIHAYADAPYVHVLPEPDEGLGIAHAVGSHDALLAVGPVKRTGLVPVFASIDNLMRGAASQALHNLNLWLGLPEHAGLPAPSPAPPTGIPAPFAVRTNTAHAHLVV